MFYSIKLQLSGLGTFPLSTFHREIMVVCNTFVYLSLHLLIMKKKRLYLLLVGGKVPHKKRQNVFSYFLDFSSVREPVVSYTLILVYFRFSVASQWLLWCWFTNLAGENSSCITCSTRAFFCPLPFILVRLRPWLSPHTASMVFSS